MASMCVTGEECVKAAHVSFIYTPVSTTTSPLTGLAQTWTPQNDPELRQYDKTQFNVPGRGIQYTRLKQVSEKFSQSTHRLAKVEKGLTWATGFSGANAKFLNPKSVWSYTKSHSKLTQREKSRTAEQQSSNQ